MSEILLVDDDADYCFALANLLRGDGHDVTVAHQATDAIARAKGFSFDVALLDLGLAGVDGLVVLDQLAGVDAALPVVCLTGRNGTQSVVEAMRRGAVDYLTKPVDRQTLQQAVTSASARSAARRGKGKHEDTGGVAALLGNAPAWRDMLALAQAAANASRTTVLLSGEPGVGKEIVANLLHRLSKRADKPLVSANAACFSPTLMESELFGHEAGAFTGAHKRRRGLFEQADGGVLFLDEIGELPLDLQSKLLRVLEGHPFRRVGGEDVISCDVRVVAATNRALPELVARGQFRADLLERLRVFEIRVPPLRERKEDVPRLAHFFVAKISESLGRRPVPITDDVLQVLQQHHWPGNVRELRNVMERAVVIANGETLTRGHLPPALLLAVAHPPTPPGGVPLTTTTTQAPSDPSLDAAMKQHIIAVFHECGGNVTHTAEKLGMSRLALRKRLQSYGLRPARS